MSSIGGGGGSGGGGGGGGGANKEDLLQQANQLWSMMDDLCEDDPEAYQRFIQKHTEQGLELCQPPLVEACLRTQILGPKKGPLYVNICSWKRVPAARDPGAPVPLCGGRPETHTHHDGGSYTVLDVAFSPSELQRAKQHRGGAGGAGAGGAGGGGTGGGAAAGGGGGGGGAGGELDPQVYLLALSFAQQEHGLQLSEQYTVTSASSRPKGSLRDVHRRLAFRQQPGRPATGAAAGPDAVSSPASLLQHISSLRMEEDAQEHRGAEIKIGPKAAAAAAAAEQEENKNQKKGLIQVISSSYAAAQPQAPRYLLEVIPGAGGGCRGVVELTVELPRVLSVAQCQLSVSQDDVLLEVDDIYRLLVDLPETVDEDSTTATFNKKDRTLTLRVDVL